MACPTCSTSAASRLAWANSFARVVRRRNGFGLAEALMASTVLAIAVVGLSLQLSAAHQQAGAVREHNTAVLLAKQLLEEIAAKPLWDRGDATRLGPEVGENSRSFFNSGDDYHNYTDDTEGMKDLTGASVPFGTGLKFRRDVTVEYRDSPSGSAVQVGEYAVATVRVTAPGGYTVKISRLLTRHRVQAQ